MTRLPVLVTRPEGQADELMAQLAALGYDVRYQPLMTIVPLPNDESAMRSGLRARMMNLDQYDIVIAVSMNAARIGLQWMDTFWPQPPVGVHWYAVGPSTADVLRAAHLPTFQPKERFESEGMLELPGLQAERIAGKKVLIWRGVGGRDMLFRELTARGATVEFAELYERQSQPCTSERWQQLLADQPVIMLSSSQALELLEQQCADAAHNTRAIILPSDRPAQAARERGFQTVLVAESARDEHMLACLQAWRQSTQ